tara:strand:+ start:5 stop:208 length:204 start_codon:yes stop_codon:yes gene_type:complete
MQQINKAMPKKAQEAYQNAGSHLGLQENAETQQLVEEHLRNVQEKRDKSLQESKPLQSDTGLDSQSM